MKNLIKKIRASDVKFSIKKIMTNKVNRKLERLRKEEATVKDIINRLNEKKSKVYDCLENIYASCSKDLTEIAEYRSRIATIDLTIEAFKEDLEVIQEKIKKIEKNF